MAGNSNELAIIQEKATIEALQKIDTQVKMNIETFIKLKNEVDLVSNAFRSGLPKDFVSSSKELTSVLAQLAKIQKDNDALQTKLNQTQKKTNTTTREASKETAVLREEKRLLNKEYKDQAVLTIKENGRLNASLNLYNKVQLKLNALTVKYNELALRKQLGLKLSDREEKSLTSLTTRIGKYDQALKAVDSTIGKNQRKVGDYASAFNPLSNSINQLTREAPAFANSIQTGFMAISNNLPIFFDAMQNIIVQNKELQAQGKPTQSVFKQLASSLFSFQTLLSVGVTLLTIYGSDLYKWAKAALTGREAIDKLKESQLTLNEAFKDSNYKNAIKDISELKNNIQLAKEGFLSKDKVLKVYNETLGKVMGSAKSLDDVEQILTKNADNYIKATLYKAAANLALDKAAGKAVDAELARQKKLEDFRNSAESTRLSGGTMGMGGGSFNAQEYERETQRIKKAQEKRKQQEIDAALDAQKAQEDIAKGFLIQAAGFAKGMNFDSTLGLKDKKEKKVRDNTFKDYLKDLEALRDRLLAVNERNYLEGKVNEEKYYLEIFKINRDYFQAKLNYIKGKNATERKMIAETQLELVKNEKDYNKKIFDLQSKNLESYFKMRSEIIDRKMAEVNANELDFESDKIKERNLLYMEDIANTAKFYDDKLKLAIKNNQDQSAILAIQAERDKVIGDLQDKQLKNLTAQNKADQDKITYLRELENLYRSASDIEEQRLIIGNSKLNADEKAYAVQKLVFQQAREQFALDLKQVEEDILKLESKKLLTIEDQKQLAILKERQAILNKGNTENNNNENDLDANEIKRRMQSASDFIKGSLNDLGLNNLAKQYDDTLDEILKGTFDWKDKMILAASAVADALTMVSERQKERTIANLNEQLKLSQENTELELGFITSRLDALNNIQDKTAEQIQERNALEDEARTVREQQQQRERLIAEQKAKAEQRAAAQQALINGALAATMTLAQLGFVAGAIPAGLALAFGVAQSIAIMSRNPIPQYYTGTDNALAGLAYTNERGAEIHTDKLGNIKSLGNNRGKQLTQMEQGDKVFTASETKDILSKFDSMPKVGTNLLSGSLLTNLHAPMVVNNSIDSHEIADLIGKKFDSALKKNNKSINIYEENGTIFKQVGNKIPEAIGKSSTKTIVVKSKRSYKDFRD